MENKIIAAILVFVLMDLVLLTVYVQQEPSGQESVWQNISTKEPTKVVSENFRILLQGASSVKDEDKSADENTENSGETPDENPENPNENSDTEPFTDTGKISGDEVTENSYGEAKSSLDWMDIKLRDVSTGNEFSIGDFKGMTILLENFELWCPACNSQQNEMKKLRSTEEGSRIVLISLDTNVNEDETKIENYAKKNGFDWYFAVAPANLTIELLEEFGTTIAHPPSAPVLLICGDQSTKFLDRKLKSDNYLLSAVKSEC